LTDIKNIVNIDEIYNTSCMVPIKIIISWQITSTYML